MMFDMTSEQITSQLGPYNYSSGDFQPVYVCGEGETEAEAITNFFMDLQKKNIDFSKKLIWRRFPEMSEDRSFDLKTSYRYTARFSVEK